MLPYLLISSDKGKAPVFFRVPFTPIADPYKYRGAPTARKYIAPCVVPKSAPFVVRTYPTHQPANSDNKSWTGCGQHVSLVMDPTPRELWCSCEPLEGEESSYPPRAGTGFAKKSL